VVESSYLEPDGSSGVVTRPSAVEWTDRLQRNLALISGWDFAVAGRHVAELRASARAEALEAAHVFTHALGIGVGQSKSATAPIVAAGHQPDLYHPGVWVKNFLLQELAVRAGATPLNIAVDSDSFDTVGASFPCIGADIRRCTEYLAVGSQEACFACSDVPTQLEIEDWSEAVSRQIEALGVPAIAENFGRFATGLLPASAVSRNLAEFLTVVRRRFEAVGGTRYLEVPTTRLSRTEPFAAFVVELSTNAERLHASYNGALQDHRVAQGVRSAAQPFPDLARSGPLFELPLWSMEGHRRQGVWCERAGSEVLLLGVDGTNLATLPADPEEAIETLHSSKVTLVPKAMALTMYVRGFVSDLFIHGLGGGAYDAVTDEVFRRYFGVEPPGFVVASATMRLPLGLSLVGEDAVSASLERLNRFEHNPDAWLGEAEFSIPGERERAVELAAEKERATAAIAQPDADRKALGLRIREINATLGSMMTAQKATLEAELAEVKMRYRESEVLADRTYPYCLWSPAEMARRAAAAWAP
jgi:hypothetical protein